MRHDGEIQVHHEGMLGEVRFIGEAIHGCIYELLGLLPAFSIIVVFLALFFSRLVVVGA